MDMINDNMNSDKRQKISQHNVEMTPVARGSRAINYLGQETPITNEKAKVNNLQPSTPVSHLHQEVASCLYLNTPETPDTNTFSNYLNNYRSTSNYISDDEFILTPLQDGKRKAAVLTTPSTVVFCSPKKQRRNTPNLSSYNKDTGIRTNLLQDIPSEVSFLILAKLSPKDLCMASAVCRGWRTLTDNNRLWEDKCRSLMSFNVSPSSWRRVYCDLRNYQHRQATSEGRERRRSYAIQMKFGLYDSPISQGCIKIEGESRPPLTPLQPPPVCELLDGEKENMVPLKNNKDRSRRPLVTPPPSPPRPIGPGSLRPCPYCNTLLARSRNERVNVCCSQCGHSFCSLCLRPMSVHVPGTACTYMLDGGRFLGEVTNQIASISTNLSISMADDEPKATKGFDTFKRVNPAKTTMAPKKVVIPTFKPTNEITGTTGQQNRKSNDIVGTKASKDRIRRRL